MSTFVCYEIQSPFPDRLDKPETLTAFSIVTEDNFAFYVPFTKVARMPPNSPCGQLSFVVILDWLFTDFDSGGVRRFQLDYAYVAWSSGNCAMTVSPCDRAE